MWLATYCIVLANAGLLLQAPFDASKNFHDYVDAQNKRDFVRALAVLDEARQAFEKSEPGGLKLASVYFNMGLTLKVSNRPEDAMAALKKSLAIREIKKPDSLDVATTIRELGNISWDMGQLEDAKSRYLEAIPLEEKLEPESVDVAGTYDNLGSVLSQLGALTEASKLEHRALAIRLAKAPGSLAVAGTSLNLGIVCIKLGQVSEAENLFIQAKTIIEKLEPGSLDLAYAYNNVGLAAVTKGSLESAKEWYGKAIEIKQKLDPGSNELAVTYTDIGLIYRDQGSYDKAEEFELKAAEIYKKTQPAGQGLANAYGNLGGISKERGDLDAALDWQTKSAAILEKVSSGSQDLSITYADLATINLDRSNYARAEEFALRARSIEERESPNSDSNGRINLVLGEIKVKQGLLKLAESYFRKGLSLLQGLGNASQSIAAAYSDLAEVAERNGKLEEARQDLLQADKIAATHFPESPDSANVLTGLGQLAYEMHDLSKALPYLKSAQGILRREGLQTGNAEFRELFEQNQTDPTPLIVECDYELGHIQEAFEESMSSTGTALSASFAGHGINISDYASSDEKAQLTALNEEEVSLRKALLSTDTASSMESQQKLRLVLANRRDLQNRILKASPKLSALFQTSNHVGLPQARALLSGNELLLQYEVTPDSLIVFAVPSKGPIAASRSKVSASQLSMLCGKYRRILSTAGGGYVPLGQQLYDLTIRPIAPALPKGSRLLICPKGPLTTLPFSALVATASTDGVGKTRSSRARPSRGLRRSVQLIQGPLDSSAPQNVVYLADLHSVHTCVSVGTYRRLNPHGGTGTRYSLVAFGDPDYQTRPAAGSSFASGFSQKLRNLVRLPQSGVEAQRAADIFAPGSTCRKGSGATKAEFYHLAPRAKFLHLACHGLLDPGDPSGSGLALTPGASDPGILQAWEVAQNLNLNAELVVLSACETGLGTQTINEGVQGMARSFHIAGAKSVAVSLWCVDDSATEGLMSRFYRHVKTGQPKDLALQSAMLETKKNPRTRHPYYWAPFVLDGDTQ